MERSVLCRSRRELSHEYLLAKIGVDTAENGPLKVRQKLAKVRKNRGADARLRPRGEGHDLAADERERRLHPLHAEPGTSSFFSEIQMRGSRFLL